MFKHQGKSRTKKQNLKIASTLSFVAGMVNITGFMALERLTTNVTGHFAYFMREVYQFNVWEGAEYLFYLLSFLFGSLVSSLLIELANKKQKLNRYVLPIIVEVLVLISVPIINQFSHTEIPFIKDLEVCLLLFAMGVQNSFVTKISNTVVRTTHLTGLFTDLGIELSQLIVRNKHSGVLSSIKLRMFIIAFFFIGGIAGGMFYVSITINTLFIAAGVLVMALFLDNLSYAIRRMKIE